jgi:peptide subunit release factor 1 (eRF1)
MTLDLLPPPIQPAPARPVRGSLLDRLLAIEPGPHRIVSCYLSLTPAERTRRAYLTAVKSRIHAIREETVAADLSRILDYLTPTRSLPRSGGLAIFACEALGLFEVAALPRVHRTRLVVDDTPRVLELVAAQQEFGTLLAVLFDRSHARFFLVDGESAKELEGLFETSRRGGSFHGDRRDAPGWGERDYHHRIREERHRHCAAVARELRHLSRTLSARGIVLAGPGKEVAALTNFLDREVAGRVVGSTALNPTSATVAEVRTAALQVASEHDRAADLNVAASLEDSVGAGWAVDGPRDTLRALARGQVRTLLIGADVEGGGFRCTKSDRLVLAKADCRGEGEPVPVQDVPDEAVEEALRQGIEVIVLHDRAAAETIDGLAAFLRFR